MIPPNSSLHSKTIPHLPFLDQLRGFAALLILVYHAAHLIRYDLKNHRPFTYDDWPHGNPLGALLWEGHTAVSLFMVLSGFIFMYGLSGRAINIRAFYKNRFLRTFPLFILLVFVGISANPKAFSIIALMTSLSGFSNLQGGIDGYPYTSMFWSLGLEWQFYAFFPPLYLVYRRLGVTWLVRLIGMIMIMRLSTLGFGASPRDVAYLTLLGRMDQFLIGMIAAHIWAHYPLSIKQAKWGKPISTLLVLTSLGLYSHFGGWVSQEWWKLLWPTWEAMMWACVLICWGQQPICGNGLITRLLTKAGEISYSIYLLHIVVISLVLKYSLYINTSFGPKFDGAITILFIILPVTLLVAYFSYQTIEKPFLNLRGKYAVGT